MGLAGMIYIFEGVAHKAQEFLIGHSQEEEGLRPRHAFEDVAFQEVHVFSPLHEVHGCQ